MKVRLRRRRGALAPVAEWLGKKIQAVTVPEWIKSAIPFALFVATIAMVIWLWLTEYLDKM